MQPSLDELKAMHLGDFAFVSVAKEIYGDFITSVEMLRILKSASQKVFLLESVEDRKQWGRYSFLGFEPSAEIVCKNGIFNFKDFLDSQNSYTIKTKKPAQNLREILRKHKSPKMPDLPPFTGGLVGYFAYEYIKYIEPKLDFGRTLDSENLLDYENSPTQNYKNSQIADLNFLLFNDIIAFDNFKQKIFLITNISTQNLEQNYALARQKLDELENLIRQGRKNEIPKLHLDSEFVSKLDFSEFQKMIDKAKHYIFEGDIFQVVPSNPLKAKAQGSLFDAYRALRVSNPSPYMFYFCNDDFELAGASPETLVKLINGRVYTYPLAGSRPRGETSQLDDALQQELLSDEKELAEHNMLVDLGRNDLGKIARIGSVEVEKYMEVHKYSHIMHIRSTIAAQIRDDKDALDALEAILPAGTLSGAPKIRACEIIRELEGDERGVYGGAVGYLDFSGNMDMCIAIRFACKNANEVVVRSGAGIVMDSVAQSEFAEFGNKAKAMINALKNANDGLE